MKNNKEDNSSLDKKTALTAKEAARILKVGVQTIKNYIYHGKIKSFKTPGGHHRILRSDLPQQLKDSIGKSEERVYQEFHQIYVNIIKTLVRALEMRDAYKVGHAEKVRDFSLKLAEKLNMPEEGKKVLELAALLHDVGKVGVSEQILGKPGKLTNQEFMAVREHSQIGQNIIKDVEYLKKAELLIRHHHEMFNGEGYPDGLSGDRIPLGARILFIAEVYTSLTSDVSYRPALTIQEARNSISKNIGKQFDPELVDVFLR